MTGIKHFVDWEQRKLGDEVIFYNDKRVPIDSKKRIRGQYPYYGATGIIDYVDGYIFDGEYVLLAEDGANILMRTNPIAYLTTGRFWLNNHAHIMKMIKGSNLFLLQLLEMQNFQKYNSGTAQPKLNNEVVKSIPLLIPSIGEQLIIGDFFNRLENAIALHQEKLKGLCALKKAYSQGIFPRKGESTPRVRFANFNSEWENRKLGDLAEIVGGGTPSTKNPEYWNGELDWYSPVELGERVYLNGSQKKITKIGLQKSSAKLLPVGTVLFTSRAGIGNTAILAKEGATNQGFQSVVPRKEYLDSYFIYSRANELKRYGERTGAGSTFIEVSGKQMSKMSLRTPALEEQKIIGIFFQSLDKIIELQKRKIDFLNNLKKSYLNKMFV